MESSGQPLGYQCEFIDSVPDDFYCKGCSLVARRLAFTSCCGESYCHGCITGIQQEVKACPACAEENFSIYEQVKYQKRMGSLQVYCSMKERGCDWSGTLDQLDPHLDPEQDNCQYIDTLCPLNCQTVLTKIKLEDHLNRVCVKRDFTCQFCAFKANYEGVVDKHLPECKYVPLRCPNLCGVTCEREIMEDHLKICRLQVVECEFSAMGCDAKFKREDQKDHALESVQHHLSLIALSGMEQQRQLERLKNQEKKLGEQEEELQQQKKTICEQEQKIQKQELKLQEQERKKMSDMAVSVPTQQVSDSVFRKLFQEQLDHLRGEFQQQKKTIYEQEQKIQKQELKLQEQERKKMSDMAVSVPAQQVSDSVFRRLFQEQLDHLREELRQKELIINPLKDFVLKRSFFMKEFTEEKERDRTSEWKSPAMYTHLGGYKFCIGIDANGSGTSQGKAMLVELWPQKGEYDHQLKWPADATFNIHIINQQGGPNWIGCSRISWSIPEKGDLYNFDNVKLRSERVFIHHSKLKNYLSEEDTLFFHITDITIH